MQQLSGKNVYLRALEPQDLDFLYIIENDSLFWEISSTLTPYSKHVLTQYLANAHQDIYEAKQLRLVIVESQTDQNIGLIDLFDFNPQHKRAGVGILILEKARKNGYASEALELLIDYSFNRLDLHQIYASIRDDNQASISLFKKQGFNQVGIKKEWIYVNQTFKDEIFLQLIKS